MSLSVRGETLERLADVHHDHSRAGKDRAGVLDGMPGVLDGMPGVLDGMPGVLGAVVGDEDGTC